jgi:hypothetical protein
MKWILFAALCALEIYLIVDVIRKYRRDDDERRRTWGRV